MHRKNKKSNSEWKLEKALHKKRFFEDLREICELTSSEDTFHLLPRSELEKLYDLRFLPFSCKAETGAVIAPKVLNEILEGIRTFMNIAPIALWEGGPKIPFTKFHSAASCLIVHLQQLSGKEFPQANVLKERLNRLWYNNEMQGFYERIRNVILFTSLSFSSYQSCMYWMDNVTEIKKDGTIGLNKIFVVHPVHPESKSIEVDGVKRPAFRVGLPAPGVKGMYYVSWTPPQTLLSRGSEASPLPVYVQTHALQRLKERADSIEDFWTVLLLFDALQCKDVRFDSARTIFFPVSINKVTIGYFIGELLPDMVLLRTFQLLTNSGTPEGKKLDALCGTSKLDKMYLGIDKLSSFMSGELAQNEILRSFFREAGCEPLLDFYKVYNGSLTKELGMERIAFLMKYLNLEEPDAASIQKTLGNKYNIRQNMKK